MLGALALLVAVGWVFHVQDNELAENLLFGVILLGFAVGIFIPDEVVSEVVVMLLWYAAVVAAVGWLIYERRRPRPTQTGRLVRPDSGADEHDPTPPNP
jgi:hypothetical protein